MSSKKPLRRAALAGLFITALLSQGCASVDRLIDSRNPEVTRRISDELTTEEKAQVRALVIMIIDEDRDLQLKGVFMGGKGKAAAVGMLAGAFEGLVYSAPFPPVAIVTVPLGIVLGGISGSSMATSKNELEQQIHSAQSMYAEFDLRNRLYWNISTNITKIADRDISILTFCPKVGPPDDARLLDLIDHCDAYMEISVPYTGTRAARYNPSMFKHDVVDVLIELRVRLIRSRNEEVLFDGTYCARNKAREAKPFETWTRNRSKLMKRELDADLQRLVNTFVHDLFVASENDR